MINIIKYMTFSIRKSLNSINNRFDNFRIESDVYNANTSFIYNMKGWLNQIVDPRIVMQTGELNSNVLLHEFGHAIRRENSFSK